MGVIKGFSDPADEHYDAVYRELVSLRRASGIESQTFRQTLADDLQALQRIAGSSVHEIDRVAGELQMIRAWLAAKQ
jgi:Iap family predicted aminopeptidase